MFGLPSCTFRTSSTCMPKSPKYEAVPFVAINLNSKNNNSFAISSRFFLSKSFVDKKATPSEGVAFLSTNDSDNRNLEEVARELLILGFKLIATKGTAAYLVDLDIQVEEVLKVNEGRPNIEDLIRSGLVQLIINTPIGSQALHDDADLRRAALEYNIPTFTTIPGAKAAIKAIKALQRKKIDAYSLQEIHNY